MSVGKSMANVDTMSTARGQRVFVGIKNISYAC